MALAEALGCGMEVFGGGGHCVQARHPVRFNLVLRSFVESLSGPVGTASDQRGDLLASSAGRTRIQVTHRPRVLRLVTDWQYASGH